LLEEITETRPSEKLSRACSLRKAITSKTDSWGSSLGQVSPCRGELSPASLGINMTMCLLKITFSPPQRFWHT